MLLGWQFLFPAKRPAAVNQPAPASATKSVNGSGDVVVDAKPDGQGVSAKTGAPDAVSPVILGTRIAEDGERTLELRVGTAPERGSYLAVFTNRGASLVSLKLASSVDRAGLTAEERTQPEHWTDLVQALRPESAGQGPHYSLAWTTDVSARDFESADLAAGFWRMRELPAAEGGPGVVFDYAPGSGLRYEKKVRFVPGTYRMELELSIENLAHPSSGQASFRLTPADIVPREAGDSFYIEPQAVAAGRSGRSARDLEVLPGIEFVVPPRTAGKPGGPFDKVPSAALAFAGVHNKYFAVLLRAADDAGQATLRGASWRARYDAGSGALPDAKPGQLWSQLASDVHLELSIPVPGATKSWRYLVYAGPKAREDLLDEHTDHEALLRKDLGFFSGIASVLLYVLRFFHRLVGNWGIAIILLTFSVRVILFPINRRSQTAMSRYQTKMKRLQPQIDELKQRFAKDPNKLRQEQGQLMQREGAFPPLFGCMTMFVQIPVFFGLFSALRTSFDLRQAPFFGWMNDLSKPDRLAEINWNTHLPFIGTIQYLNVLPPLMVGLWILQQALMPKPTDPQAARMQKMMMFMPAVMGLFLYNYAAGLSVYMITQSVLGILELKVIKKYYPVDDSEVTPKKGFMARLMERAQQAQQMQKAGASARKKR